MKKKKLKKRIRYLECKVDALSVKIDQYKCHCENYKPKTVEFRRWQPLPSVARNLIRVEGLDDLFSDKKEKGMYEGIDGKMHQKDW